MKKGASSARKAILYLLVSFPYRIRIKFTFHFTYYINKVAYPASDVWWYWNGDLRKLVLGQTTQYSNIAHFQWFSLRHRASQTKATACKLHTFKVKIKNLKKRKNKYFFMRNKCGSSGVASLSNIIMQLRISIRHWYAVAAFGSSPRLNLYTLQHSGK